MLDEAATRKSRLTEPHDIFCTFTLAVEEGDSAIYFEDNALKQALAAAALRSSQSALGAY